MRYPMYRFHKNITAFQVFNDSMKGVRIYYNNVHIVGCYYFLLDKIMMYDVRKV